MYTQILIVGGGPVGLALAIELGMRGILCVIVEQNEPQGALQAPRSKMINVRAMTHVRRWGLADAIRRAVPVPLKHPSNIIYATCLLGHKKRYIRHVVSERAYAAAEAYPFIRVK